MTLIKIPTVRDLGECVREGRKHPQVECGLVHRFAKGIYIRELTVPAGTRIITKYHRTQHPYVVSKGIVDVYTERDGVVRIEAPFTGITEAGTIRMAQTVTETVWTTFHLNPTEERDPDKLVDALTFDPEVLLDRPELLEPKELTQ